MVHPRTVKRSVHICRNFAWWSACKWRTCDTWSCDVEPLQVTNLSRQCYTCIEKRTNSCRRLIFLTYHVAHSGTNVPDFRRNLLHTPLHCSALLFVLPWKFSKHISTRFCCHTTRRTCRHFPEYSAICWGTALQAGKLRFRVPIGSFGIFLWLNPSGRTMALGLTEPLTEMSAACITWG
jgi:hypothetical protein